MPTNAVREILTLSTPPWLKDSTIVRNRLKNTIQDLQSQSTARMKRNDASVRGVDHCSLCKNSVKKTRQLIDANMYAPNQYKQDGQGRDDDCKNGVVVCTTVT